MKIYFCDICNQSIPLKDLDEKVAVAVKGKIVCASCSAATVAALKGNAAAGPGPSGLAVPLSILGIAIAASAAIGWYVYRGSLDRAESLSKDVREAAWKRFADLEGKAAAIADEVHGLREGLDELKRFMESEAAEIAARRRSDAADVEARIASLKRYLHESEILKERVQELEVKIAASVESGAGLQRDVGSLKDLIATLDSAVRSMPPGTGSAGPAAPAPTPEATGESASLPALTADLQRMAKKLKDGDPAIRWEGVEELGQSRDPRVVPYLIPHLKDADDYVRRQAAEALGDVGSKLAISPLIDALMDEVLHVRDSVYAALRKLSGQNIKFEPTAKKDDRVKQQRLWRAWFEQNQSKLGLNG